MIGPPPVPVGRPARYVVMEESQIMFRHVDAGVGEAHVRANLAVVARLQGDATRAETLLRDALARARAQADDAAIAHVLAGLGRLATLEGDTERAAEALDESLALRRQLGDVRAIVLTLGLQAELAVHSGDRERARALFERALGLAEQAGDRPPRMLAMLALARLEGPEEARRRLETALAAADELGARTAAAGRSPPSPRSNRGPTAPPRCSRTPAPSSSRATTAGAWSAATRPR